MRLPGGPAMPRCSLDRDRSPTSDVELDEMRRHVWRQQGVISLRIEDITDPWLRQAITNEATRRWGPRQREKNYGR